MARFRRWYRRRYGRRSYYRLRRYRRRYRKFVNGSSRSRVRVKIPVNFNASLNVAAGQHLSDVLSVTPFYYNATQSGAAENCLLGGLFQSPLFNSYVGLYDSFKLDGMKVSIAITSAVGAGQGAFPSLACLTAWDRQFQQQDFDTAAHYPSAANIRAASSFLASTALNNSITKLTRSCYASDLFERSTFIDVDSAHGSNQVNGQAAQDVYFFQAGGSNLSTAKLPGFAPALLFCCDTGSNLDSQHDRPVNLVVECMYYVTFRNPKYGGGAAAAKVAGIARSVEFEDLDHEPDMDDDDPSLFQPPSDDDDDDIPPSTSRQAKKQAQASASGRVIDAPPTLDDPPPASFDSRDSGRHPHKAPVVVQPLAQSRRLNP